MASLIAPAGVPYSPCSLVQMEEMVFMAVINFKVLPAASAAASAAAAAANSIYNCHMMAMGTAGPGSRSSGATESRGSDVGGEAATRQASL